MVNFPTLKLRSNTAKNIEKRLTAAFTKNKINDQALISEVFGLVEKLDRDLSLDSRYRLEIDYDDFANGYDCESGYDLWVYKNSAADWEFFAGRNGDPNNVWYWSRDKRTDKETRLKDYNAWVKEIVLKLG